jgi:hypothetical protein
MKAWDTSQTSHYRFHCCPGEKLVE